VSISWAPDAMSTAMASAPAAGLQAISFQNQDDVLLGAIRAGFGELFID